MAGAETREDSAPSAVGSSTAPSVPGYSVGDRIGAGGFGEVFAARHLKIGRDVAIKVLHAKYSDDPQAVARFVAEARAVGQLSHPGIVDLFELGELPDGRQFLVMERIRGRTLREVLRERTRIPLDEAVPLLGQIAEAVDAAHAAGIAHRDLKPDNVFVLDSGSVKLIDFGLAKLTGDPEAAPITETGSVFGTPLYMSPEQCRGRRITTATDAYSFGVLAYHVLTGEPPFTGEALELALHHLNDKPAAPSKRNAELDGNVDRVVLALMEKDPANRPLPLAPAVAALAGAGVLPRRRVRWRVISVGMLVVAACVVAGFALRERSRSMIADDPCEPTAAFAGLWDAPSRVAIDLRMRTDPTAYLRWQAMRESIDRFANDWRDTYRTACTTPDRKSQPVRFAQRLACLDNALLQMRGSLLAIAETPRLVAEMPTTPYLVAQMPDELTAATQQLTACKLDDAVRAEIEAPPPEQRDEIRELLTGLYRVNIELRVKLERDGAEGQRLDVDSQLAEIDRIRARLEALGSAYAADALGIHARFLADYAADYPARAPQARPTIEQWFAAAERMRYDAATARAAVALAVWDARMSDLALASQSLARAATAITRAGSRPELAQTLSWARAQYSIRRGAYDDALREFPAGDIPNEFYIAAARYTDAIADARKKLAGTDPHSSPMVRFEVHQMTYRAYLAARDIQHASEQVDAVIPLREEPSLSPTARRWIDVHALSIAILTGDAAAIERAAARFRLSGTEWGEAATAWALTGLLELAAYGFQRAQQSGLPTTASIEEGRAYLALCLNDPPSVARHARSAVAADSAGNAVLGRMLLALSEGRAGRVREADRLLDALRNGDPMRDATLELFRGLIERARDRGAKAAAHLAKARDGAARFGTSLELGETNAWLGVTLVEQGTLAEALLPLEEADALAISAADTFHYWLPMSQFALARVHWDDEDARPRARALAESARDGYARLGRFYEADRMRVETWLASHHHESSTSESN